MNGDIAEGDQDVFPSENGDDVNKDGLLSQDHAELCERVSYLEKKVRQQEDEIVCLKSALADVIRRLGQAEAGRAQTALLPNRPAFKTPRKSGSDRKSHLNPLENANLTPHRSSTPPTSHRVNSPRSSTTMKKWSSMSNTIEHHGNSHSSSAVSVRDPEWKQEDGYLKIYLRGRAVNLYAPSTLPETFDTDMKRTADPPNEKLQLEWVYGYRGRDCRSNLYYLPTGETVYFSAAVVVLHNLEENTQRHYTGHTDDVKCIAIHPDHTRVASGQVAGHDSKEGKRRAGKKDIPEEDKDHWPHVRIWDSISLNTLHVVGIGDFDRAVCCISFSKKDLGNHMVVVDEANEHVMSVWDVSKSSAKPKKITQTKSSTEPVLAAEFHPLDDNQIVTCGKGQITFWNLENGSLSKKTGIFDKHDKPKYVLCVAFAENGDVISGDSNGAIFVWSKGNNRISQAVTGAHEGGIFSICVMKDGSIITGGGKDRKIVKWDASYKRQGIETEFEIPEVYGGVRMLSQGHGGMVLVGTTRNCILKGSVDLEIEPVVQGHMDELWGVSSHPGQHQFLTVGSDKKVFLWDSMTRTVVWNKEIGDPAHCCCFHPKGDIAAIGTETGRWFVIDLSIHEIVCSHTDGNEQIECIEFSPAGDYLAVGSRDNFIYVYEVSPDGKKYTKAGRCQGHSSFITHIDWSKDGTALVSNSGDYEVLYWKVPSCKQETSAASLRDMEWATGNCTLCFNAAGIWPDGADGTDVNNCARSHKCNLIASADDFGKVNLYKYPCCQPKAKKNSYGGHSSHVTNASFLYDDSRLITTGGRDMAIMQWQVL
ncbi:hypothetical protein FSP39_019600 [Pinctada imbricata]|uniref:Uncharacterized protein n=1 Tax=Pinctada imbricata TaxID=66713 RepID=A0AA89BWY8_PINIB|nr:hypothetical protein FSP39_019600 [Pinctada imbricata]